MVPSEWVAAARANWRTRGESTFPAISSVEEARALQIHYVHAPGRPTVGEVIILLRQIDNLIYMQGGLRAQLKSARLAASIADQRAEIADEELRLALSRRPLVAPPADGRAAAPISRRRAEALLNHLAAGGPEGANARLRLIESLCGEP